MRRMSTRASSDSFGHASISRARSGSRVAFGALGAPDFAHEVSEDAVFGGASGDFSGVFASLRTHASSAERRCHKTLRAGWARVPTGPLSPVGTLPQRDGSHLGSPHPANDYVRATVEKVKRPACGEFFIPLATKSCAIWGRDARTEFRHDSCNTAVIRGGV